MKEKDMRRVGFIRTIIVVGIGASAFILAAFSSTTRPEIVKVGIIGLDTSHCIAFTEILNDPDAEQDIAGFKVVAAYPKGSSDIVSSVSRIPEYTQKIQELGVEIVNSIDELLSKVDVVLLETNDGRLHLEQSLLVLKSGKPLFIDKPLAGSLSDAIAIFNASKKYKTPIFSTSSLRYLGNAELIRKGEIVGKIIGADVYSPAKLEKTHPDLFWYGIHGVEILYTIMKPGCKTVTRYHTPKSDIVVGEWNDDRIGVFRGIRSAASGYGGKAFGEDGEVEIGPEKGYRGLMVDIVKFFRSGIAPVSDEETLEIYAFMEAADESKRRGGIPVSLAEVMEKARKGAPK